MLQYTFFVLWRMRGSSYSDGIFIAWVIVGVIYSTYSCAWVCRCFEWLICVAVCEVVILRLIVRCRTLLSIGAC